VYIGERCRDKRDAGQIELEALIENVFELGHTTRSVLDREDDSIRWTETEPYAFALYPVAAAFSSLDMNDG
jgi:hypothetical protein